MQETTFRTVTYAAYPLSCIHTNRQVFVRFLMFLFRLFIVQFLLFLFLPRYYLYSQSRSSPPPIWNGRNKLGSCSCKVTPNTPEVHPHHSHIERRQVCHWQYCTALRLEKLTVPQLVIKSWTLHKTLLFIAVSITAQHVSLSWLRFI